MKKVNVLLSSYNGEKYIEELINSVLAQEGVDLILTIRDDGSSDKTIEIIKSFDDSRIRLIEGGENLGPAKSFLKLLRDCDTADYYAYCDQDDIWYPNKLSTAVNKLSDEVPSLFMSTYDMYDEALNTLNKRDMEFYNPLRIETTLMYRCPSGCIMVLNDALRDILISKEPESIRMHDFWTLLIALGTKSNIVTEDVSLLKYRLHEGNTVGLSKGFWDKVKRFKKSLLHNKHERYLQAKSLYDCFSDQFDEDTNELLLKVVNYKKGFNRFRLANDKRFRETGSYKYVNKLFVISVLLGLF